MSNGKKIAKITFKTVILAISLFIYAFFIFRLCSTQDAPESVSSIVWNETARAAYAADPDGFQILSQEPSTFITDNGRFWISDVVYLPQAKQLQLTIKYNDSTVKYLKEALANQANSAKEDDAETVTVDDIMIPDEPFDYSVLDNSGNRYHEYASKADRKQNYNYRRLVFENITIPEYAAFYIDMYYVGAIDYSAIPYGSLLAWNTALDIKELETKNYLPDDLK